MSAEVLSKIYHDPKNPGSLGGVERLVQRAKQLHVPNVTRKSVQEYLRSKQAYTLHKPARRRFTRNHTYVAGIDAQWQTDLVDMQGIAKQNGIIRYLLTVIDVFCLGNPGALQGRQGNHNGVRAGAYNRKHTPPSAITDRQRQGVLQLGFPGPDEAPQYPALCH